MARRRNLWVEPELFSDVLLLKEAIEFSASGVERALCRFSDTRPDQRAAFCLNEGQEQATESLLGKVGITMPAADDFTAEHVEVVTMTSEGFVSESLPYQVE